MKINEKWKEFKVYLHYCKRISDDSGRSFLITLFSVISSFYIFGFSPMEYLGYNFAGLSWKKKKSFISHGRFLKLSFKMNPVEHLHLLGDKGIALKRLKEYAGREWIDLRETGKEEFSRFLESHSKFIVKRPELSHGKQIRVYENINTTDAIDALYTECIKWQFYIVEDFVKQHEAISMIYPHAVNTLRIHTANNGVTVKTVLDSSIRFGSRGSKLDMAEEMYTVLLGEDGTLISRAAYHNNKKQELIYGTEIHPDSLTVFQEQRVPFFKEAEELAVLAAGRFPEIPFIGWDVAISRIGPVIIEGNGISGFSKTYQLIWSQMHDGTGCRAKYENVSLFISGVKNQC